MTDTDSLFMRVTCNKDYDVYDDMIQNCDRYDLSNVSSGNLFNKIKKHCDDKQIDF